MGAKNLLSRFLPSVVSILTKSLLINAPAHGNRVRQHNERFENLPEDIRVSKASEDAGFMRKISRGQYFVTTHDMELTRIGYAGSCRECTSSRDDERSKPKRWIRGNTKVCPVLEVKINSMKNDGSQAGR